MPYSAIINQKGFLLQQTETQPDSMQKRDLGTHCFKRNVPIKPFPSELREPHRRRGIRNGGDRGKTGHQESKALKDT